MTLWNNSLHSSGSSLITKHKMATTVGTFLAEHSARLQHAGIITARLDCLILLEDILQKDRSLLLAHPEQLLSANQEALLNKYVTQRINHLPLAYIRGRTSFFGREFKVNKYTLVPRPETEAVIMLLKKVVFTHHPTMADIGTGSGCIGITAALEVPDATVHLYDISPNALAVAKQNAQHYDVRAQYYQADLLAAMHAVYTVLLANLPYVPLQYPINQAASFEPKLALFSGMDGLDHYRLFWKQIAALPTRPKHVIIESFPAQHSHLKALAQATGYALVESEAFAQHFAL